ncbi:MULTISPECIES: GNAT family N-acetyltransferase [Pseudomonas]|uniref:Ribosomal protein S18 acetylase RimI n=1 Tax=Pseudomonas lutea TaxID=243924 RepID=A0A9X8M8I2_9PSED|nr:MULTISPECIES: GNAT family N-acetyltransferase [Pseudomonas]MBW5412622.1 GNAT family N-acetyltransferase [Pseudomonas sp. MAG002Y]MCG7374476.1 GNAT family N-acetyltransferase [Pseudomonas luteola]SEP58299.1 Ribosomal protein S18 acetylase RimI [Pseudomonas lutea]
MNIRPITAADFDQVWPIIQAVVQSQETYALDPAMDRDAAWKLWVELPKATFVAERDGQILGTYYIKPNAAGPGSHVCNCGYMTAEAARGQGVASALCAHSLDMGRELGFLAMQFNSVVSTNQVAVALWKKHGFEVVGTLPKAYRHRTQGLVDCYVMFRAL